MLRIGTNHVVCLRCGFLALVAALLCAAARADVPRTPAPAGARVYFIEPQNGATIKGPVRIVMGLSGMGVAPAGIDSPNTGHHHVLVNLDKEPPMDAPLPATDQIRHFGGGQTETTLNLPPGKYTLQLLVGDKNHIPHQPPIMSEKISITVTQ